ncbi:hypothetical protein OH492_07310 [Vibrio chagasii]|nr:hypothetical protein [Vibrio chagasii]
MLSDLRSQDSCRHSEMGKIQLAVGDEFTLIDSENTSLGEGNQEAVGLDYKKSCRAVSHWHSRIYLMMDVCNSKSPRSKVAAFYHTKSSLAVRYQQQGHQQKGGGLSAEALTDKDKRDIVTAAPKSKSITSLSPPSHRAGEGSTLRCRRA